ncbi:YqaA family protein [Halorhabdus salina]|uniref:YqaA family protein n=1 Tax=Halorhabdus salina TaxID=2750670 RepID=UPI0035A88A6D
MGLLGPLQDFLAAGGDFLGWFYGALEESVQSATGPLGLALIGIYSFLIAFVLPLPSEIVLAPAGHMLDGLPYSLTLAVIVFVSGVGKAAGSVFAFHIGQEAKEYGPLVRRIKRSRFDVIEWSERKTVQIARRFGYVGLALALSVPGFPDTISIYAFTILEEDYLKFALATFAGSVGRLLVTIGLAGSAIAIL